jgi:hypothetical protein
MNNKENCVPCSLCDDSGWVEELPPGDCATPTRLPCPGCDGSGRLDKCHDAQLMAAKVAFAAALRAQKAAAYDAHEAHHAMATSKLPRNDPRRVAAGRAAKEARLRVGRLEALTALKAQVKP